MAHQTGNPSSLSNLSGGQHGLAPAVAPVHPYEPSRRYDGSQYRGNCTEHERNVWGWLLSQLRVRTRNIGEHAAARHRGMAYSTLPEPPSWFMSSLQLHPDLLFAYSTTEEKRRNFLLSDEAEFRAFYDQELARLAAGPAAAQAAVLAPAVPGQAPAPITLEQTQVSSGPPQLNPAGMTSAPISSNNSADIKGKQKATTVASNPPQKKSYISRARSRKRRPGVDVDPFKVLDQRHQPVSINQARSTPQLTHGYPQNTSSSSELQGSMKNDWKTVSHDRKRDRHPKQDRRQRGRAEDRQSGDQPQQPRQRRTLPQPIPETQDRLQSFSDYLPMPEGKRAPELLYRAYNCGVNKSGMLDPAIYGATYRTNLNLCAYIFNSDPETFVADCPEGVNCFWRHWAIQGNEEVDPEWWTAVLNSKSGFQGDMYPPEHFASGYKGRPRILKDGGIVLGPQNIIREGAQLVKQAFNAASSDRDLVLVDGLTKLQMEQVDYVLERPTPPYNTGGNRWC